MRSKYKFGFASGIISTIFCSALIQAAFSQEMKFDEKILKKLGSEEGPPGSATLDPSNKFRDILPNLKPPLIYNLNPENQQNETPRYERKLVPIPDPEPKVFFDARIIVLINFNTSLITYEL